MHYYAAVQQESRKAGKQGSREAGKQQRSIESRRYTSALSTTKQ